MDKFEQYNLNLGDKQKDLVLNYLQKIKKYVDKHSIEIELYDDIEEMVFEKLSNLANFSDLIIIKTLKEVGEPEIIFSDYVVSEKTKKVNNEEFDEELFYEKLQKTGWIRDNENAIFLGISHTLAQKFGISVLAVRIILLILFLPVGISAWLYILAGILLPVKGVNYSGKSSIGYFKTQFFLTVKNLVSNTYSSFVKLIGLLSKKGFLTIGWILSIFKYIISFIVKNIFPIFRFFIFGIITIILVSLMFVFITILSLYFTNFNIENIYLFYAFPSYFLYSLLFGIFSLFTFAVYSFIYAIKKKVFYGYILLFGFISFFLSIFFAISTGLDLSQKYLSENKHTQETQIELGNPGSYNLDLSAYFNRMMDIDIGGRKSINFVNSTGSNLELKITNTVYANDELFSLIKDGYSEISLNKVGDDNIKLVLENNKIFSKKVPISLHKLEYEIYIPQGIKVMVLPNYRFNFENVYLNEENGYIENQYSGDCSGKYIYFDEKESKFLCNNF